MTKNTNAALLAAVAELCPKDAKDAQQAQARMDCKRIFGVEHPLDVITPLDTTSKGLFWLESLFEAIAADTGASLHIKRLASMGAYLACDHANYADAQHEQMRNAVLKGGANGN